MSHQFAASIAKPTSAAPVQEHSAKKLYFIKGFPMGITENEIFELLYKGSDRGIDESAELERKYASTNMIGDHWHNPRS